MAIAANRETLKTRFLEAAAIVDSDQDELPDAWERLYLSNLNSSPTDDSDGDGIDNFNEFAFCSRPNDVLSRPTIRSQIETQNGSPYFSAVIRRPAGSLLNFVARVSSDLTLPLQDATPIAPRGLPRNLFDGTGAAEAEYPLTIGSLSRQFITIGAKFTHIP
ncbi:MAG: hypothetical protein O2960_14340 [Verrucomicrobia bacterium]|nr:hypothetical protein [Verrucomicrobiota bacterium]